MVTILNERPADAAAREALLDRAYGAARHTKPSQKLREGRLPADGLSLVALDNGVIVGTLRLWHVNAGAARPALLLGPLAVYPDWRNRGIGSALTRRALRLASLHGHGAVLLVGDASYYGRFGFSATTTIGLRMTGQHEPARLLGLELRPGALDAAQGLIVATGAWASARAPVTAGGNRLRVSHAA